MTEGQLDANKPTLKVVARDRLAEAVDRSEIMDALARYCRGVDRLDVELLNSVYHADAEDDHVVLQASGPEIGQRLVDLMSGMATSSLHYIALPMIRLDGDFAYSETYWMSKHLAMDGDTEMRREANGRYVDSWERRSGEWRIKKRQVLLESVHREPIADPDPGMRSAVRRDRKDPSYEVL